MPIYEYRCTQCGKELEIMHKVSDPAPTLCPECKAEGSLERLMSRTSFQLKGGGWYSDLYGSTKPKDSSSSSSAPSSSSSTASSSSSSSSSASSTAPSAPASSSSGSSNT